MQKQGPFPLIPARYSVSDGIPKTPILMNPTKFTLLAQRLWFLSTQSLAKDVSFKKRILAMPFTNFLSTHLITITLDTWCITLSSSKFSSLAIVQQPCLPARNQCYHLIFIIFKTSFQLTILMTFMAAIFQSWFTLPFICLKCSFTCLSLESSPEKDCPPSKLMIYLGILFDIITMTLSILQSKIPELLGKIKRFYNVSYVSSTASLSSWLNVLFHSFGLSNQHLHDKYFEWLTLHL